MHIPSSIEAEEAEEIGVEHLLRDIRDTTTVGTLSTRVSSQLSSLRGLQSRLVEIRDYLKAVVNEELPVNHQIIYNLQDIFNLLPDLDGVKKNGLESTTTSLSNGDVNMDGSAAASGGEDIQDLVENNSRSFSVANNDQLLVIYLSSLIRSVIALHELVNNRMENAKEEGGNEEDQSESKKEKDEKEKEKKDSEKEGEKKKGKK